MNQFSNTERKILLDLAADSIKYGLQYGKPLPIDLAAFTEHLRQIGACFVTLEMDGGLRGCIGSLEARQPLVLDLAQNAFAAAFQDPRFPKLTAQELPQLSIHISVLSAPRPMQFTSEEDLISKVRPNIDGLILIEFGKRGTFLPSVWETLPDPKEFLENLKLKAGLPANYWSNTLQVLRYTTEVIE